MKLVLKNNNEHALQVGSKELPMWWCPECKIFECFCEIADLKGENGHSFPLDAKVFLTQGGKHSFHPYGGAYVKKTNLVVKTYIQVNYGIILKGSNEGLLKNLYPRSNQKPDKAYVDKLLKHYQAVMVNENLLDLITFIPLDKEFYQAIMKDLDFFREFIGLN